MAKNEKEGGNGLLSQRTVKWQVHAIDKTANWLISIGGIGVIVAVLGILVFIASQVIPLFVASDSGSVPQKSATIKADSPVKFFDVDAKRFLGLTIDEAGVARFIGLPVAGDQSGDAESKLGSKGVIETVTLSEVGDAKIVAVTQSTRPFSMVDTDSVIRDDDPLAAAKRDAVKKGGGAIDKQVPVKSLALALSDGRVLHGSYYFIDEYFINYGGGDAIPESLKKIERKLTDIGDDPSYIPECVVFQPSAEDIHEQDELRAKRRSLGFKVQNAESRETRAFNDLVGHLETIEKLKQQLGGLSAGDAEYERLDSTIKAMVEGTPAMQEAIDNAKKANDEAKQELHDFEFGLQQKGHMLRALWPGKQVVFRLERYGAFRSFFGEFSFQSETSFPLEEGESIVKVVHYPGRSPYEGDEHNILTAVITSKGRTLVKGSRRSYDEDEDEFSTVFDIERDLTSEIKGTPADLCLAEDTERLLVVTKEGDVYPFLLQATWTETGVSPTWRVSPPKFNVFDPNPNDSDNWGELVAAQRASSGLDAAKGPLQVTSAAFMLDDVSVLFCDSHGGCQSWFPVRNNLSWTLAEVEPADKKEVFSNYQRIHTFAPAASSIQKVKVLMKGKSFLTGEADGSLRAINMTSEHVYFSGRVGSGTLPAAIAFPKKGDGALAYDETGTLHHWWIDAPHADTTVGTLFGKVFYEGHEEPKYEWQSTTGTDDVESKLSMVPLIFGTLKGAFYALLFSIPIAILAALYTSEFMSPRLRSYVKPTIEIMAALPSVVLGFLAALWIAPNVGPNMPQFILFFVFFPPVFFLFGWIWQQYPPSIRGKLGPGRSFLLLFVLLLITGLLSGVVLNPLELGTNVERALFPKAESASLTQIDPKTFEPISESEEKGLSAGDFRSWTGGGRPVQVHQVGVVTKDTNTGEESYSVLPADAVAYRDPMESRLEKREGFQRAVASLKEGKNAFLNTGATGDLGYEQEIVAVIPKGWWQPGGNGLFTALMWIVLIPLVGIGLKAVFFGITIGKRYIHGWKPNGNRLHPSIWMESLKDTLSGEKPGARFVLGRVAVSGLQALVVVAIAYGLALLVTPIFGSIFCTYDHPTAGQVVDYRRFFLGEEGWKFDQINSLIVGFAMGFAVIPIIYTISEDALSSVPNQLRAASLGCGASPWQTAARVVLPAALPGIFSAIVVGLGRAVGETMIVVMAAGGQPIMEFDPLSGFQSLSGAIAVELPEAAQETSHYRSLFLAGLLLFAMTFVMNTIAEVVRIRLRKKMARV